MPRIDVSETKTETFTMATQYNVTTSVMQSTSLNYYDVSENESIYFDANFDAEEYAHFEQVVRVCVLVIFSLIVAIGFVGNLLVIVVVLRNKKMQNTTNILIVSLAVADLSFIVFCVPFTAATYSMTQWVFGDVWCRTFQFLIHVCAYVSVWSLVLMSLDRYLAVVHPITSMRLRNTRNAYILVYLTWILMLIINVPVIFEFAYTEYDFYGEPRSNCMNIGFANDTPEQTRPFYVSFFAFGYVIPLTLTCILYGFMIKRLLYGIVPGGSQRADSMRSKKRVTRMVVVVVVIFAICWLPIQVIFVLLSYNKYELTRPTFGVQLAANCLAYLNSCVNPVLYAFLSENFRRSFKRILCCSSDPHCRFEYERTNTRGIAGKEPTKETLLNNSQKNTNSAQDKNCNSENTLLMQTLNKI